MSLRHQTERMFETLESRQMLSTFMVDIVADESDGNYDAGDLSLREAVLRANATSGADTIIFSGEIAGSTITLTAGEMLVNDDVTIRGVDETDGAADITVSGDASSRVFNLDAAAVALETLTLTEGDDNSTLGGAIYMAATATLEITGCTFFANTATNGGAIYNNGGTLTVADSTFQANIATYAGGAIVGAVGSTNTITGSTFLLNTANTGGAIKNNGGTIDITNSTFSANNATGNGAGLYNIGAATITNSTLAYNKADSDESGSGSGGGIYAKSGDITLTSTLLAHNVHDVTETPDDITLDSGTIDSGSSYNLVASATSAGGLTDGVNSNIVGEDPLLEALADQGGSTSTHALQPGSPALDTGTAAGGLTTDQRGYSRTGNSTPDIGAFENHTPAFGSLDADDTTIQHGDTLTLTASAITDGDDNVAQVAFYADTDADGIADAGEILGTDADGSDGYTLGVSALQTAGFALGSLDLLAVATDSLGFESDTGSTTITVEYKSPTLGGVSADDTTIYRGDTPTLTATGATAGDGAIASVSFYRDADADGIADSGELLGTDSNSTGGYTLTLTAEQTAAFALGSNTLLAVATDAGGYTSNTVSTGITVEYTAPSLGGISAGASTITRGDTLTLTATGVTAGDGAIASVSFYRDADADGIADAGELLGTDSDSTGGYTLTLTAEQTAAFALGSNTILAVATDAGGYTSNTASTAVTAQYHHPSIAGLNAAEATITRGDTITLTATGVEAGDGAIASVSFYFDADADGIADAGELLGADSNSAGGYTLTLTAEQTAAFALGANTLLAIATDAADYTSNTVATAVTAQYHNPSITGLNAAEATITRGDTLTLTATGVEAGDGAIASVSFYFDADADGIADAGELLGTDSDSTGGYTLTLTAEQTAALALGSNTLLAVAADTGGYTSNTVSTGITAEYHDPSVSGITPSASQVRLGETFTLTATGVEAGDSAIAGVAFYFDADADGIADAGELLGSDSDSAGGYTLTLSSEQAANLAFGSNQFLAVATDALDYQSAPATGSITAISILPTLTGVVADSSSIAQGEALTLTAQGVNELGDAPGGVSFYLDADHDGLADIGELLGTDSDDSDGYSLTLSGSATSAFTTATQTFLAVASDSLGESTDPVSTTVAVVYSQSAQDGTPVDIASGGDGAHHAVTRNQAGDLVVFTDTGDAWQSEPLTEITGAPDATGDPIIFSDPKDGYTYAAVPSAEGFLLFLRDANGDWDFTIISDAIADPADIPVTGLTQFTSTSNKVLIAGLNAAGELVAFQQTGAGTDGDWAWSFVNISDDLAAQGMTTPDFTELVGYSTNWNSWTIAGIDSNGDIQGVWINPASFSQWRVDNLSDITGAPAITGQLSVTLTPWSAINLGGVNSEGHLVVTWWIPSFGGQWTTSDLTTAAGGETLATGKVAGFVTTWGAINYAGINADGEVAAYWWTPFTSAWQVSPLTTGVPDTEPRPTASLTSHVSDDGAMNILGTSDEGDLVRVWWQPGSSAWSLTNLTDSAQRA